jgi:hypothetical protein
MIRLEETTVIAAPIQRCFDLARSVEVHLIANVHSGEQALAIGGVTSGLVGLAQQVTWRAKHFGVWHDLTKRDNRPGAAIPFSGHDDSGDLPLHASRPSVSIPSFRRNRNE